MESLSGIIGILIVFGLIMGFHEFGHFIIAKLSGMTVHEFSFGFGPAIFSRRFKGTLYSIRLIPFIAYVNIAGMDPQEDMQGSDGFYAKSYFAKLMTLLGGPLMNFVLALLLLIIMGMAIGEQVPGDKVVIGGVQIGSPADKAGLQPGDHVLEVNGIAHPTAGQTSDAIHTGTPPVRITVARGGKEFAYRITPTKLELPVREGYFYHMKSYNGIGISLAEVATGKWRRSSLGESVVNGGKGVVLYIEDSVAQFASLVTGKIPFKMVSGPVGIMRASYEVSKGALISREGVARFFTLITILSVAIGFFNLLPVPALDGGRIVFVTLEAIMGKRIDNAKIEMVHKVSLAMLLMLIMLVTFKDVAAWITGKI